MIDIKNLHIFKVHNLVSLEINMHPWNHHHNQCNKHIYHLQKFLCVHNTHAYYGKNT